jgi:hypothetical protein
VSAAKSGGRYPAADRRVKAVRRDGIAGRRESLREKRRTGVKAWQFGDATAPLAVL